MNFRFPFARKENQPVKKAAQPTAVSDASALYSTGDFDKYNPDILIGRKGYGIYKKIMRDEQVKAAIKFKRDAITSRDFFFELDEERSGLSEEEIKRRVRISEEYIDQMRGAWMDVLNFAMSAMYNGFSLTEMIFGQIEVDGLTYWGVNRFKLRPFDTFIFDTDRYGDLKTLVQRYQGNKVPLDIRKFLHFVVNPDVDEYYGQSELMEVYRPWFDKQSITKFRNIWLERHAGGFTVIKPSGSKTITQGSQEHTGIQSILRNLATSAGILLPNNVEMESTFPNNNVAFKEAIDDANTSISRAILIPNLLGISPQGSSGSFAQAQTQFEAFLWTLEADSRRLEEALNEQVFRLLGDVNFGDQWYPKFKFKSASEAKKFELLKLWHEMVSAGAVLHTDTDEDHIRDLIDFPLAGEEIKKEPTAVPGQPAAKPGEGDDVIDPDDDMPVDETVTGRGRVVTSAALTRALKRVDFAVIAKTSEDMIDQRTSVTASAMGDMIDELLPRIAHMTGDPTGAQKLKFDSGLMAKMRTTVKSTLGSAWNLGTKHARNEVDKAKGSRFVIDQLRAKFIEKDFFNLKSFAVSGKLSDDALAVIKNIIFNGAKGGKTVAAMTKEIYETFVREGFISIDEVPEALQDAFISDLEKAKGLNVNVAHRVNTMVRTNTFEAINEARYAYFTDPELEGFVEALEYSAILDSRTTQICEHLDGRIFNTGAEEWDSYRPPNHFNCRSLLIPVTEVDTWTESETPTVDPQRGFG